MSLYRNPMAAAIASILACCSLLAACGGGGNGVVRPPRPESRPPPPPAPPPAPLSTTVSCPTTSNCTLDIPNTDKFLAAVLSPHALEKQGPGGLLLSRDTFGFASGTEIRSGFVSLHEATLRTDVHVASGASLMAQGSLTRIEGNVVNDGKTLIGGGPTIAGNVSNHGNASFSGVVTGNWSNDGRLDIGDVLNGVTPNRIDGDFRQSAAGLLSILLPSQGPDWAGAYQSTLIVGGHAYLDGALELRRAWLNDGGFWYGYLLAPLPTAPTSIRILHAAGGVFGQFTEWKAASWLDDNGAPRPLFITGSVRYGANDVWFDLTRVSIEAAMAGQGVGGIALASAGNLDRALAIADGFATAPNPSQSRFLRSAGRLLWLDDAAQAARSLDSLSGSLHVDAMDALAYDDALARGIGGRTLALQPGDHAGAWSRVHGGDTIAGFDQWLSPRLLAGATAAQSRAARSDHFGGHAHYESPQASLYLRWFGNDGWYAGGSAGYARHALALDRRIDLAAGGQWKAHAQRRLGIASLNAEAGRVFRLGSTKLGPYAALDASMLRSERALEQGHTGFELALQANTQTMLKAGIGVRAQRHWRLGNTGWLRLEADASYRQRVMHAGDPLRAAFTGVPDLWFDVRGHASRNGSWLDVGLDGGFGRGWAWSLGHSGSLAGDSREPRWQFGLRRAF